MSSETEISSDFEDRLVKNSVGSIDPKLAQFTLKPYDQWPPMLKAYGFTDPELISTLAEAAPDTVAWLKDLGIRFLEASSFISSSIKRIEPSGGGEAVVEALATAAENEGITFHYETTARSLILNEKAEVRGVRAWSHLKGNIDFQSEAVVLASGGFEGNLEMMVRYVGSHAYLTRPLGPGGAYCKGEGIEMALNIGAAPAGQYDAFHAASL